MNRREFLRLLGAGAATWPILGWEEGEVEKPPLPNIVVIMADDLGYGDVGCLNPEGKIPTPNMDRLGREGVIFTDVHSGSAVCTPTRYGLLTGRYAWRTSLQSGVLQGFSGPLIEKGRMTVASLLKGRGYATACIGKWHLGWTWPTLDGEPAVATGKKEGTNVDFDRPIEDGPLQAGFDYFFGIPASLDMIPYLFVENDRVLAAPTEVTEPGKGYAYHRGGMVAPGFRHEEVLPLCTEKVNAFIDRHVHSGSKDPFFLYFPLSAPHAPIVPTKAFAGATGLGPYGDFVRQCDDSIGRILERLDRYGLAENTLFIVTSDNGCSPMADFEHLKGLGHDPSYHFRGHKADIFEGGHRIPFLVRWPAVTAPGSMRSDTLCLTDLIATAAEIVNVGLPDDAGEDSVSFLPALRGKAVPGQREAVVHHSSNGSFAIRRGKWKLELCPGSGGWSDPRPGVAARRGLPMIQLYDVEADWGEQRNLQALYPDVTHGLISLLERYVEQGRSTPGAPQKNDVHPDIWKALALRNEVLEAASVDHIAKDKKARLANGAVLKYADKGIAALTDGMRGTSYYDDGYWVGVEGEDLEVVIDVEKIVPVERVSLGALEDQEVWIFDPEYVEVSLSVDGSSFTGTRRLHSRPLKTATGAKIKNYETLFDGAEARFVKVRAANRGVCPEWHKGAGGKAWVFVDEIVVR